MMSKTPVHFFLVCLVLVNLGIAWPLYQKNAVLRSQVSAEKQQVMQLDFWHSQLTALEKKPSNTSVAALEHRLKDLQSKLEQDPMHAAISQVSTRNGNELHFQFDTVNFDQFMAWVSSFSHREGVEVVEASVKRLAENGEVKAELVMKV